MMRFLFFSVKSSKKSIFSFNSHNFARNISKDLKQTLSKIRDTQEEETIRDFDKTLEDKETDQTLDKVIQEKMSEGKSDYQVINEILGGKSSDPKSQKTKKIKSKDELNIEKQLKKNTFLKFMESSQNERKEETSLLYHRGINNEDVMSSAGIGIIKDKITQRKENLNKQNVGLSVKNLEKESKYKIKEGIDSQLLDSLQYSDETKNKIRELSESRMNKEQLYENTENQTFDKDTKKKSKISLKNFKNLDNEFDDIDNKKSFKELVNEDLNYQLANIQKNQKEQDEKEKLSKIANKPIIDISKKEEDEKIKKTALLLTNMWQLNVGQSNHWYRRLKREEKEIAKKMIKINKLKDKQKLKKLQKEWNIDNDDNFDIDYNDESQSQELKLNKTYQNFKELAFFGDDIEYLRHYKRTCRNIQEALDEILNSKKQAIFGKVLKNQFIQVSAVKMNKACSLVHIFWDIPFVERDSKSDELFTHIELKLNQSIPFFKSKLGQKLNFRYIPELRFHRDEFSEEFIDFKESVESVNKKQPSFFEQTLDSEEAESLKDQRLTPKQEKEYDNDIQNIINLEGSSKEEKELLMKMNEEIKNKSFSELSEAIENIQKTNKINLIDLKSELPQDILEQEANSKPSINAVNPFEIDENNPKNKREKKSLKKRNKLLNAYGLSEKDNQLNEEALDISKMNDIVLNFAKNYEYDTNTKKSKEHNKNLRSTINDFHNHDTKELDKLTGKSKNKKTIDNSKRRSKSDEFWENLEKYS